MCESKLDSQIQEVMWLVFDYAKIMDGFDAKEGENRTTARNAALNLDRDIRNKIKLMVN